MSPHESFPGFHMVIYQVHLRKAATKGNIDHNRLEFCQGLLELHRIYTFDHNRMSEEVKPPVLLCIGMAGSGKTTFMQVTAKFKVKMLI